MDYDDFICYNYERNENNYIYTYYENPDSIIHDTGTDSKDTLDCFEMINKKEEFEKLFNKYFKDNFILKTKEEVIDENFFGIHKTEMFYDQESKYKTLDELIKAIDDYIYYYNYDRIKVKLKGLKPVNYRLQSSIRNYL